MYYPTFTHEEAFKAGQHLPTVLSELEADFMAGWYMGGRDAFSAWSRYSISQSLKTFYSLGGYSFNSPDFHGTPEERAAAILAGLGHSGTSTRIISR